MTLYVCTYHSTCIHKVWSVLVVLLALRYGSDMARIRRCVVYGNDSGPDIQKTSEITHVLTLLCCVLSASAGRRKESTRNRWSVLGHFGERCDRSIIHSIRANRHWQCYKSGQSRKIHNKTSITLLYVRSYVRRPWNGCFPLLMLVVLVDASADQTIMYCFCSCFIVDFVFSASPHDISI